MDPALASLVDRIRAAAADRTRLRVRAGGTKDFYGNCPQGAVLDPRTVRGIVAYEPSELAIAVRCGTPLAEVEAALDAQGQMLAFEPPHFGDAATIGGCIATGLAGPRRASYGYASGGVRDFVLGAKLIDGRGQLLSFGGMVMKNVAGYDVARLLAGSLGILGVIVEVSLKVVPKPQAEATLRFAMDQTMALGKLNDWGGQPIPVSASAWWNDTLHLRLSGARSAVAAACRTLGGETLDPVAAVELWHGVREHKTSCFAGDVPLWRLSLPSTAAPITIRGEQTIEWGGALRWIRSTRPAPEIRAHAHSLGGHATHFRGGQRTQGVFGPLAPGVAAIHRRLCTQFDPAGIFDCGRMLQDH
jgi:glycolate oxidase FAD binding subunit